MAYSINEVYKITKGDAEGSYLNIDCNITAPDPDTGIDETFDALFVYRENDPFGMTSMFKQWLLDNPEVTIHPFVPKVWTPEELREWMPTLTARQFRLGLVASGISPSQIDFIISQMPNGPDKDTAEIEWEYATTFKRTHPLIDTLSAALNLTPESVDTMWTNAINL